MEETKTKIDSKALQDINDFLINNFLITIPIFDGLNPEELRIVAKYMNIINVSSGEIVFKEGDAGDYVCFVVDGTLDVLKKSETGDSIVISTLSKGRSIGDMAVIDEFPRSATVKARTKATLIKFSQENFSYMVEKHSSIGVKILKGVSRLLCMNLRKTSSRLADYMLPIS